METPVSRSALYGKLAGPLFRSLESATAFCKLRSNPWVELTHWLHQLTQQPDNDILHVLRHYQIPLSDVEKALLRQLDMLPAGASAISDFSHHIDLSVEKAWMLASVRYGDNKIRSGWLLLALLTTPELRRVLSSICAPLATLPVDELTDILPSLIETSPEAQERPYDGSGLASTIPGESSQAIPNGGQDGKSALAKYCQDMTAQARDGKIDPVTGREHEIRTMTDILLRRRQNNPLLTGEAGVGKTAVVEGFALAIAQGEVPPALREVRLLALDVGALLAGASMKGEFESRLKGLLEEAGRSPQPVILFVDEVHTLVGAGGASGTGDAANLLKPALARGTLRTIGATTWSEYKRHIEKDPALTRRFQVLQIAEPEEIPAMEMVRGLVDTLEKHHNVLILDEAVRAAVQLSHRYIPARQLPDKAISLLDTAAARVALTLHTPPASVQFLRQQLKAAEMERSLLQKQEKMGIQSDERRDALMARIFSLNNELTASESRWQRELELVHTLQELRVAESDADDKTTLQQAETALREWQGDAPVVFPEVSAAVVAAIVADWTGIPAGRMVKDEASQVLELPARLAQRVTGQDGALAQIGERIQTARAGLGDPRKPVGVFMLAGPSGVGKTETALALAEAIYGGEQNLVTINMSEFQEAHTVSTLKGAPPGYVGYGEGGVLTEAVRRHPWSVVLLDEIEKAHHDVHELFYQVFDKGGMEDGEGTHVDFKNGDPDLPIIVGRTYNQDTMPPWGLPGMASQSGIFSHSLYGGPTNGNMLRFDDKTGAEEVKFHAEKDLNTTVKNNETHTVMVDRTKTIIKNETNSIGEDRNTTVTKNDGLSVKLAQTINIGTTYRLDVGDQFTLRCGNAALVLHKDGSIEFCGKQLMLHTSDVMQLIGKGIDMNPDGGTAVTADDIAPLPTSE
ncbi:type VI secretion system ATPase TssH [Salmonella enterica subsp. enterica]|uniref:type VI secretion system ATPase TssH n=1 Tax=Salmonella enterica TaxID=28901 RepID=UPI00126D9FF5|nr:type VI secretion system ATPase TssH [Salmonella enterica]ECE0877608.1 type VI secretion system ATPase TssH [Salmonella enterica subsp. enterica]EDN8436988.1 type VI secretion system ATPase TssH [Salmonella enterica subsp. enterica serovar Abaetetuba]EEJ8858634.1 type VI secretion system ATPase TssH [Salmonella enterica subsp. enterica]